MCRRCQVRQKLAWRFNSEKFIPDRIICIYKAFEKATVISEQNGHHALIHNWRAIITKIISHCWNNSQPWKLPLILSYKNYSFKTTIYEFNSMLNPLNTSVAIIWKPVNWFAYGGNTDILRGIQNWKTSKMELFVKIVNGWKTFTIFTQSSVLDVWHGSEYVSGERIQTV